MILCNICGVETDVNFGPQIICKNCGNVLITGNTFTSSRLELELPELSEGTVVIIDNYEHPFHNSIGIIRAVKHKHYRVEINGRKLLLPSHWVKEHEPHEFD